MTVLVPRFTTRFARRWITPMLRGAEGRLHPGDKLEATDEEWAAALGEIRDQLEYEIVNAHLGLQEGFKALCEHDPQVQAALKPWERATPDAIARDAGRDRAPSPAWHLARPLRQAGRQVEAQAVGAFPMVVATGGSAEFLFKDYELVERIVPKLTLMGLAATRQAEGDADE